MQTLYDPDGRATTHIYGLIVDPADPFTTDLGSAGIGVPFGVAIIAEKGPESSWDRVPSQDQYRAAAEWAAFRANLDRMKKSQRQLETFASPSAGDLARVPLRWSKSFRYLGVLKTGDQTNFDGTIPEPAQKGLKILEASYGLNLLGQPMSRPGIVPLCVGNVTDALSQLLNGRNGATIAVDVVQLGDPAPDLAKELIVRYIYLEDPAKILREVRVPAEAHGRELRSALCLSGHSKNYYPSPTT